MGNPVSLVDFSSNDYLGYSFSEEIYNRTLEILNHHDLKQNGATGSRLLSGNHKLFSLTENVISNFHRTEAALLFNSGYDANIGLLGSVPQRGDIVLYDELCHASIRDGIRMSLAKSYKFKHNDLKDLRQLLDRQVNITDGADVYVVTESVFSMDGDTPNLGEMVALCQAANSRLIVDEAHALGIFGPNGEGKVQELGLESQVFARIVTFGKALGCHGAAILGSDDLKTYMINFARSFIYTTGLSPHAVASIWAAYEQLKKDVQVREDIIRNIAILRNYIIKLKLNNYFISSDSAIQSCLVSGNENVKRTSKILTENGMDVKPIMSPTVPKGKERLRICLHSFNLEKEINQLVEHLATFIS